MRGMLGKQGLYWLWTPTVFLSMEFWPIRRDKSSAGLDVSSPFNIPDPCPLNARRGLQWLGQIVFQTCPAPWTGSLLEQKVLWIRKEVDHLGVLFMTINSERIAQGMRNWSYMGLVVTDINRDIGLDGIFLMIS